MQPNDGYIAFHILPQGVLGVAGQRIVWWAEARKTGETEYQHIAGGDVPCELNSTTVTKSGFFGGEFSLLGGEFDSIRASYYVENGPVTFGAEGEIRNAQRGKRK